MLRTESWRATLQSMLRSRKLGSLMNRDSPTLCSNPCISLSRDLLIPNPQNAAATTKPSTA